MVIFRDIRRFEITVTQHENSWMARILAFVPGRLYPTSYLLREVSTQEEAITAVRRTWQRLFPEEEPLHWHAPGPPTSPPLLRRPRRPEGHET